MRVLIIVSFFFLTLVGLSYLALPFWAQVLVIWGAALFVLGPLLVRLGGAIPAEPDVEPFDPAVHDATLEQLSHLSAAAAQLAPFGFERLGELFIDRPRNLLGIRTRIMLLVLENDAGTRAVATAAAIANADRVVQVSSVELTTRFPTHVRVTSSYGRAPIPRRDMTRRRIEWFPQLRDAGLLLWVHEALVARDDAGVPTPKPLGPLHLVLADYLREEYDQFVADGLFRRDASGAKLVPTLRGAMTLALRSMWPFSPVLRALVRRRARALLAELGLSELETGLAA